MMRIYYYGDSGPYGEWYEAGDGLLMDGFGRCTPIEVSDELWAEYGDVCERKQELDAEFRTVLRATEQAARAKGRR